MRTLGRIRAMTASCGVAVTAAATGAVAVHADTGWSTYCSNNGVVSKTILNNPTLAVAIGGPGPTTTPTVALCFATSGVNQSGSGELAGGVIGVTVDNSQQPTAPNQVACYFSDADAQIQPLCGAYTTPTATWTPAPAPAIGGTLSVSIPFIVCAGINVVVGYTCATPNGAPPTLAATGLIVSNVVIQGGPSCCPDGAVLSPTTAIYVNGVQMDASTDAGAGVNPDAVSAGTKPTATNVLCLGSQCIPLPSAFVANSGAPVADLIIAGTEIPITPPSQVPPCITVGAPNGTC